MNRRKFVIRAMEPRDWHDVAALIHDSTNAWYEARGFAPIFTAGPTSTLLFCEVYESLDPGCCFVAEDCATGRLAGSCFYHPRATHVSLGIMNVHPDSFRLGIARQLLQAIVDFADEQQLPIRLVSSALNLDSYSLYNRAGFIPRAVYQDLLFRIPDAGLLAAAPIGLSQVRPATIDDIASIVALEEELVGIRRPTEFEYFIANEMRIWHTSVMEKPSGELTGYLCSVRHSASNMVGPGAARSDADAIALAYAELNQHRGNACVLLAPATVPALIQTLYEWGGRNCELHLAQVRGKYQPPTGIVIPSFMPETG